MSKAEAHLFYGIRATVRVILMRGPDNSNLTDREQGFVRTSGQGPRDRGHVTRRPASRGQGKRGQGLRRLIVSLMFLTCGRHVSEEHARDSAETLPRPVVGKA